MTEITLKEIIEFQIKNVVGIDSSSNYTVFENEEISIEIHSNYFWKLQLEVVTKVDSTIKRMYVQKLENGFEVWVHYVSAKGNLKVSHEKAKTRKRVEADRLPECLRLGYNISDTLLEIVETYGA